MRNSVKEPRGPKVNFDATSMSWVLFSLVALAQAPADPEPPKAWDSGLPHSCLPGCSVIDLIDSFKNRPSTAAKKNDDIAFITALTTTF